MKIRFTKMHGLGNDFVMIDAISQQVSITPDRARKIADRNFGVGCDQILIVEAPTRSDADFKYRIFNADGSEVENCGNGARCFAIFVRMRKLTGKHVINAETANGLLVLNVVDKYNVTVDMGIPELSPSKIPFIADCQASAYPLDIDTSAATDAQASAISTLTIGAVSMGNPHAVTQVDDVANYPVKAIGPLVEAHPQFPNRVNAGFMSIVNRGEINLRVYERGSGETLACGTGACAAVVAGRVQSLLDETVTVNLPGGSLVITWAGPGNSVMMTGPTATVFHGQVRI
ncbi:MAG TPA: diaminopimelate epimerase [Marinagarivorans sp.]